jgi:N-acetylated-alpha-linked acidic dipeptidase
MKIAITASLLALLAFHASAQDGLEQRFDAHLSSADQDAWMKLLAAEPNHVSSPHDKANAEWILARFREWGWDARIEAFKVLYPTPIREALDMPATGKAKAFRATLQEPNIPGDTTARSKQPSLPAYVAFQGDGDVTAPLVYVNYGMEADYKKLAEMGISVKGKIVIARYGQGWRGLKPKLAQEHGAIGCLIYSDPKDDGYAQEAVYPAGSMRPARGFQRGSVADMTLYPGDPLTPGVGATENAKRLTRAEAPSLLKIPTLPISYADAQVFLSALGGPAAPASWRGALPITYRPGPGSRPVHLMVKSEWSLKPIYDVVATLKGAEFPDQWVIRGNHHDGWVYGAADPLSGMVAEMDEARALGALVKEGWKPKRTIVYTSWDAEEPLLLGSTEWAETHAAELQQKAVLYLNSDANGRGTLSLGGSEDLQKFATGVADQVIDPETHASVGVRRRAVLRAAALAPDAGENTKAHAKEAADPKGDVPIEALGSGSDYSAFLQRLGVETLDIGYDGEGTYAGVYHSRYDTYEHFSRFVDPGFVYGKVLAETAGALVIRAADADLPLQHAQGFAAAVTQYFTEVKKLAGDRREAAEKQKAMLADHVFALAADPTISHADPVPLAAVPVFDFAPMDTAIAALGKSAAAYDAALAANGARLSPAQKAKLQGLMQGIGQTVLVDAGLPGRDWYKNMISAPGRFTGYGAKTLPGIREAIEEERWADVPTYVRLTAGALDAYRARLDQATALLKG